jgi:hypothetical protein
VRGQHQRSLPWINLFGVRHRIQAQVLEVFCKGCSESSERSESSEDDFGLEEQVEQ